LSIESHKADALSYLLELGLSRLQAETYLCLVSLGRSKASRLAKELGLVRPEVYRILSELMKRELVTKLLASPAQYEAIDPEHGLRMLVSEFSHKAKELAVQYGEIRSFIDNSTRSTEPPESEFKLLPRRDRVIQSTLSMINRAGSYLDVVYSKWGMARLTKNSPGLRALAGAHKRGVRIRIVAQISESNYKQAAAAKKYAQIRHADDITFYINLCDGKEVLFGPKLADSDLIDQQVDVWTNNKTFANAFQGMFDALWEGARRYRLNAKRV